MTMHILVIAKEPSPGVSKTRLCPPCSPDQAASVARASIADTLAIVSATCALSRTLVLAGRPGNWISPGIGVIAQHGDDLAERLAAAFKDSPTPALLIGMDTPQITTAMLEAAGASLMAPGVDAVIGPANDGGYWTIGFKQRCEGAFVGVPMSAGGTAAAQCRRLDELGLTYEVLPTLQDMDYWEDAIALARALPGSHVERAVKRIAQDLMKASA